MNTVPRSYEDILHSVALSDERFVALTAENRSAIRDLPAKLGERFIDFGICEQTLVGAAAGLALRGRIPVVHALATFLTLRAFEFIRTDVGIAHLPVKLVGTFTGFASEANGPTHQSLEDVALMRGIPGMQVWCPADAQDLALGLEAVLRDPAPCYIRYNAARPLAHHDAPFELGRAEIWSEGNDITLLTYGLLFGECLKAVALLRDTGLSVGLINMRMLKPVDTAAIAAAARRSKLLVTVEDHFQTGGLYSIVAETLVEQGVVVPVLPLAFAERWFKPALLADALAYEGFDAHGIAARVRERYARIEA
ncbi:transketolase [Methylomagnum ishizawai]|uniref:1-deoxy-D-xylulose-5-phosphate synthase n=1 Tax=Methylomagnum ishizawai TaxID=1760988 RepID=A0A1Y6DB75_9GAMM|nr:transketolase C-terminal domain-containing protein [Methylomagnum ishizawai]SMF97384.1 transketolase [Methylomagnum ishizawai]